MPTTTFPLAFRTPVILTITVEFPVCAFRDDCNEKNTIAVDASVTKDLREIFNEPSFSYVPLQRSRNGGGATFALTDREVSMLHPETGSMSATAVKKNTNVITAAQTPMM
jgi:hypothetical protein